MNITLVLLLIFSIAMAVGVKLINKSVEWKMIGIIGACFIGLSLIVYFGGRAGKTMDIEVLNGEVVSKEQERVSCSHSYSCNCRSVTSCSGSGKDRSCSTSTQCDTCYEHSHDYDWNVRSNVGSVTIDRVDRQGVFPPPRWKAVMIGEPFAATHIHTNYVKAVPESLFHLTSNDTKFASMIPAYPKNVYDYYRINRALTVGVNVPDLQEWSNDISNILRKLGPQKQANVITVFVKTDDPSYEYALKNAWLNAKKNDVVVVFGTTQYPKIDFVRVISWTDAEIFKVKLRDSLQDMGQIDRPAMIKIINDLIISDFKRKQMADFKFLENEIDPPDWLIYTDIAIILLVSAIFAFDLVDRFNQIRYGRGSNKFYRRSSFLNRY